MFKKLLFVFVFLIFALFVPSKALTQEEFQINVDVEYKVQNTGITHVKHEITLTNLFSSLYAKSYTLNLESIEPKNVIAKEKGKEIPFTQKDDIGTTTIRLDFEEIDNDSQRVFDSIGSTFCPGVYPQLFMA